MATMQDDMREQDDDRRREAWDLPTLIEAWLVDKAVLGGGGKLVVVAGNPGKPVQSRPVDIPKGGDAASPRPPPSTVSAVLRNGVSLYWTFFGA